MDDNELFLRFRQGDDQAFRELVERYERRAFWVAYNIVKDEEDARDIVQDALIRVVRSAHVFDPAQKFKTWLFRIISNAAIDRWRKAKKTAPIPLDALAEPPDRGPQPDHGMVSGELQEQVARILSEIPEKYRKIIVLRDIEGMSCKEIGEVLGLTHSTARWRLHHARKLFADLWRKKVGTTVEEILGE